MRGRRQREERYVQDVDNDQDDRKFRSDEMSRRGEKRRKERGKERGGEKRGRGR